MDHHTLSAVVAATQAGRVLAEEVVESSSRKRKTSSSSRGAPRSSRRKFKSNEALQAINRDYMGIPGQPDTPLFGAEFKLMFRLSKARFQKLMEDVMGANIQFFMPKKNLHATEQSSIEAKLLLPLKCLAYGVPPHTFIDYFQMSRPYARKCCLQFDIAVKSIYMKEFLRLPTATDLKAILALHKTIHGVEGMVGSLDCSHTYWKNCPKAWQGSYKGKEKMPSIVLEAVSDYHLFFWHASYGYTGNLNDRTILSLSPLLDRLVDGSFHHLEEEAGVVPFQISNDSFTKTWITVDGIYPKYSRFVKGIKEPVSQTERRFTQWQEAVRKDVERAFGVLKGTWQFLERPILLHNLTDISNRVTCCIILHNILVTDRVMGEVGLTYDPSKLLQENEVTVTQPQDLQAVQAANGGAGNNAGNNQGATATGIGLGDAPADVVALATRGERFRELKDVDEYSRLHAALMARFL